jgi:hypothetical protein
VYMAARDVPSAASLAAGVADSDTGWTLRFPRIRPEGLRSCAAGGHDDKPWYDCMTQTQLREAIRRSQDPARSSARAARNAAGGAVFVAQARKRKHPDGGDGGGARPARAGRALVGCAAFDTRRAKAKWHVLDGREACVLNGTEDERRQVGPPRPGALMPPLWPCDRRSDCSHVGHS